MLSQRDLMLLRQTQRKKGPSGAMIFLEIPPARPANWSQLVLRSQAIKMTKHKRRLWEQPERASPQNQETTMHFSVFTMLPKIWVGPSNIFDNFMPVRPSNRSSGRTEHGPARCLCKPG